MWNVFYVGSKSSTSSGQLAQTTIVLRSSYRWYICDKWHHCDDSIARSAACKLTKVVAKETSESFKLQQMAVEEKNINAAQSLQS